MTTDPETPYRAKRKKTAPNIRPMHTENSYMHGAKLAVLVALTEAAEREQKAGRPFDEIAAVTDYYVDQCLYIRRSKSEYEERWGWSAQQRKTRWDAIVREADDMRTWCGRKRDNQPATNEQPTSNQKPADSNANPTIDNQRATNEQPSGSYPYNIEGKEGEEEGGEGRPPFNPPKGGGKARRKPRAPSKAEQAESTITAVRYPPPLDSPDFRELFAAWIRSRITNHRKVKTPWPEFFEAQLGLLARHGIAAATWAVEQSTINAYQGLFPEKFNAHHGTANQAAGSKPDRAIGAHEGRCSREQAEQSLRELAALRGYELPER